MLILFIQYLFVHLLKWPNPQNKSICCTWITQLKPRAIHQIVERPGKDSWRKLASMKDSSRPPWAESRLWGPALKKKMRKTAIRSKVSKVRLVCVLSARQTKNPWALMQPGNNERFLSDSVPPWPESDHRGAPVHWKEMETCNKLKHVRSSKAGMY